MPAVLRIGPYRFYFYNHKTDAPFIDEPPHIHVDRDKLSAKFWLKEISLAKNVGFRQKEVNTLQELATNDQNNFWINGMSTSVRRVNAHVEAVYFTRDSLIVDLMDGRSISVPLTWYPKLLKATPKKRTYWEICGGGYGIHWPEIDEDLSTEGLLRGSPAPNAIKVVLSKKITPHRPVSPRRPLKRRIKQKK